MKPVKAVEASTCDQSTITKATKELSLAKAREEKTRLMEQVLEQYDKGIAECTAVQIRAAVASEIQQVERRLERRLDQRMSSAIAMIQNTMQGFVKAVQFTFQEGLSEDLAPLMRQSSERERREQSPRQSCESSNSSACEAVEIPSHVQAGQNEILKKRVNQVLEERGLRLKAEHEAQRLQEELEKRNRVYAAMQIDPSLSRRSKSKDMCFNCGQSGHWRRDCSHPPRQGRSEQQPPQARTPSDNEAVNTETEDRWITEVLKRVRQLQEGLPPKQN